MNKAYYLIIKTFAVTLSHVFYYTFYSNFCELLNICIAYAISINWSIQTSVT